MEIGYREEDNNKKVKLNLKSILKNTIIGVTTIGISFGSGALSVQANEIAPAEAEKVVEDRIIAEQIGYETYMNGENSEILKNIDTMAELDAYEQGIKRAEDSDVMQQKWEQMGYDFIAKGKLSEGLDYDSKISNKLALQMDAYQKGIKKALEEGNIVDPNTITPLDENIKNPTPEQENLEVFRKMLLEGWVDMGKKSVDELDYFADKNTSSLADNFFSQRNMPISASALINAGRVQEIKEIELVSLEQLEELADTEKMGDIKDAENAVKSIAKGIETEKENTYSLGE